MNDFTAFMAEACARVDTALDECLPSVAERGELAEAMRHIVFSGGKRLRPALVELGALDVGGELSRARGAAAAVELMHAYSLVHDDLPAMDDAQQRRGKPCVHVLWGDAMGVLAGDALLTLSFEVLARGTPADAPVGEMCAVLARHTGWAGMVGGQCDDLAAEGAEPDLEHVRRIHEGKTAALLAACLQLGALAGGGDPAHVERLGGVGLDLGLAFQIVDDLLDVEGESADLGKAAGADAEAGKLTWPAVVGAAQARSDAEQLVSDALQRSRGGAAEGLIAALGAKILARRS
ncbi:MAG: farnesyl-diphosphate synthase [Planctomycetota bacterium]|nr:MAG: farnesyl-diphosphate synthase [Planctomycetota bacterium]